ncbi:serine hydrolase [Streptomyces europaeiscabiei]|uniref:Serine hydrolase n=3 Tax=Streptomyces europaeiscabiei TaxID=146819 RepID=A0ABU4NN49_9ACTN|nr:serine hydrolase [Streptomyces europaeiscabiei]MDX3546842.1 serine hydrolase [Streptomyces europaeiscabiei]MDX3556536.1 serine hydrolase [Streptomyces europaeiscabiei]MDX3704243.1 serine hydrolase [Streptomyces europaeiscabiei]MDX3711875.1 serine hydrolase [Streptomyces europaeiscabiei]
MAVRQTRAGRRSRIPGATALASLLALGGAPYGIGTASAAPPPQPPPQLTQEDVDRAVDAVDGIVERGMDRTGVPGVAVAVVYKDRVVHLDGYGKRHVGQDGRVDPDTVFQLASLSKPLASTVVAGAVGDKTVDWDDPVAEHLPGFALKDPWVTGHVTVADLFSHRSGLPDHAGDLLEDLGYDREYILDHLRLEPLTPFRASYAYTNFGVTAASQAVADAAGTTWEKLAEDTLYKPAGMDATSSRFSDYEGANNKAFAHVPGDGAESGNTGDWEARHVRDADAQSPAGGASSTVRDLSLWLRLQLANGELDGDRIIAADPLERTHLPEIVSTPPPAPAGRAGFYGLGWNVSYDDLGRLRLSHSGAFALGANTNVTMVPGEQLGIAVLTNGAPVGLADAVSLDFLDTAQHGKSTEDWLDLAGRLYEQETQESRSPTDYSKPPDDASDARADSTYTGTYANPYFGPLTVTETNGDLTMRLGPKPMTFRLTHYAGDTFHFETVGENASGPSGVTFKGDENGRATSVTIEAFDESGLGTFRRS